MILTLEPQNKVLSRIFDSGNIEDVRLIQDSTEPERGSQAGEETSPDDPSPIQIPSSRVS